MKQPQYIVSVSPHIHSGNSIKRINYETIGALAIIILAGWFFFGISALKVIAISVAAAVATEFIWQKSVKQVVTISDGSAIITGILLGFLLSPASPWWLPIIGSLIAIVVGKHLFGGLGNHPFNSALVGWAYLSISYGDLLKNFVEPAPKFFLSPGEFLVDPPMIAIRDDFSSILEVPWKDLFYGNVPGNIGTISVIAVLIAGAFLLYRRIITWHIPASFIASTWLFSFIFWKIDPEVYASPTFHILSGGVMLGAFFLATEKGTAPVTNRGMIAYGIGCGVMTMIIRLWGAYPDGVAFAILLMNCLTPLLDKIKPKTIGRIKEIA